MTITIRQIGMDAPIHLATREFARLISTMTGEFAEFNVVSHYDETVGGLWIGEMSAFGIARQCEAPSTMDDEIFIKIKGDQGMIAGGNPRSVLLAVYRYARELGCRFVSVGTAGERIPQVAICDTSVSLHEVPSYRHRGVCIEGAVSAEHVIQMIDLLPKLGMNSYFIQFREAYTFFERWYAHRDNPNKPHPEYPIAAARDCVAKIADAMAERGVLYQAVGHGWTCEPFGVPGLGWEKWTEEIPPEVCENFAQVKGVRGLWEGVTLNTHACYGNPRVRRTIIEDICGYLEQHKTVDELHFWLADGHNGVCECELCRDTRPADAYVEMLNELDAELTRRGLNAKIVFLIYLDLLWPPVQEKLNNPDRFILMFAPITRSYRKSFAPKGELPPMDPYVRNDITLPREVAQNVSYLKAWQEFFGGDSFDYDYHYMWAWVKEPGTMQMARVLWEDIRNLKELGLNGFISCQVSRTMFPNALNMVVMGETLWNRDVEFDDICADYFAATYGTGWETAKHFLDTLSERFFALDLETADVSANAERVKVCRDIKAVISAFVASGDSPAWHALSQHAEFCAVLVDALEAFYRGEEQAGRQRMEDLKRLVWASEDEFSDIFDAWGYVNVLERFWF